MSKSIGKNILAVLLSSAMLIGAGAVTEISAVIGTNISVSAAATQETPSGSFDYEKNDDGSIIITKFTGSQTQVVVPSKIDGKPVTKIGKKAFQNCQNIKSITLPDCIIEIDDNAFNKCTGLTDIIIPDSVTKLGAYVFYGCAGLKNIKLSASVTVLDMWAFKDCTALTSLEIPNSVTQLGFGAFDGCSSLTDVTFSDSLTVIEVRAFYDCESLADITLPDSIKVIGGSAFANCKGLTSITIPNSMNFIDSSAFSNCKNLTNISVNKNKNFSSKGGVLFDKQKTKIVICPEGKTGKYKVPEGVTEIGKGAFKDCTGLTGVTIPDGVKEIDSEAFSGCTALKSITVPGSVTYMGNDIFSDCVCLKSAAVLDGVTYIESGIFSGCTSLTSVTMPDSIIFIGSSAFLDCTSMKSITIPDNVVKICDHAFGYYYNNDFQCVQIQNFTVSGKKGTAAEKYANYNGFRFVDVYAVEVTDIKLSQSSLTLETGKSETLKATISPSDASDKTVTWKTGNSNVATVKSGKVTAVGKGTTTITATASNGKSVSVKVTVKDPLENKSTVSKTSVPQNTSVTVSGAAAGGEEDYKYAFYYKKSTSPAWQSIGEIYGSTKTVSFVPAAVADYLVRVNVKDSSGKVVTKQFTIKSTKPTGNDLVNNSTISASNVERNTKITIKGSAKGGSGNYQYAFYYKKASSPAFTAIGTEYGTATTAVFTPASSGTYSVRINVRDSSGTVVTKQYTVISTAILTNNSTISAASVAKGTAVKLTAKASGGTAPYTYAFYYKKSTSSAWTKIGTEFGTASTASFTPAAVAAYNVKIVIKDKTGKTAEKTFTVTSK